MNAITSDKSAATPAAGRSLVVAQAPDGRWMVRDRRRGLEVPFATQRAALHFALFDIGEPYATGCALVIPPVRPGMRTGD